MSENSAATQAGATGPVDDADATLVAGPADETMAPDMAPTAGAFDAMGAFDTEPPAGDAGAGQEDTAAEDDAAPTGRGGLLARIPGERRQWMLAGMVSGGILLGGLASAGVAWKMIGDRNAEVAARTAKLDLQSSRLAEQEARIEVLTRAVRERPLPDDSATGAGAQAPAAQASEPPVVAAKAAEAAPPPAAATPVAPPPATPAKATGSVPADKAADPPRPAGKPAEPSPPRAEAGPGPAAPPGSAAGASPSVAGSGICNVPGGSDGVAQMRKCIEWFAGRSKPAAKATP